MAAFLILWLAFCLFNYCALWAQFFDYNDSDNEFDKLRWDRMGFIISILCALGPVGTIVTYFLTDGFEGLRRQNFK
ncbi:MAG: hypothetical protein EKK55_17345 [Rhodocyclaceae bacterium]|nr:MAG: hypothetical protein EKK55_17345 [Rhodocyclaceae bacterium]